MTTEERTKFNALVNEVSALTTKVDELTKKIDAVIRKTADNTNKKSKSDI